MESKLAGDKLFEVRYNDRGYQKGDTVTYREYDSEGFYLEHTFEITYVTSYNQKDNWVVFGERSIKSEKNRP